MAETRCRKSSRVQTNWNLVATLLLESLLEDFVALCKYVGPIF